MDYRNVREQVTDLLREEVLLGKFEPGDPLREIPLAERFRCQSRAHSGCFAPALAGRFVGERSKSWGSRRQGLGCKADSAHGEGAL